MRRLGVKFSISPLKELGYHLLSTSTNYAYSLNMLDPRTQKPLHTKIDYRWIQSFMERFRIVSRARTGKHDYSPAKQLEIEMNVAVHLGTVSGLFYSGYMDEDSVENADETHFMINVDNGHTLGFSGDKEVKYADLRSGGALHQDMRQKLDRLRKACLLYTSPSPRDQRGSRMPSSA